MSSSEFKLKLNTYIWQRTAGLRWHHGRPSAHQREGAKKAEKKAYGFYNSSDSRLPAAQIELDENLYLFRMLRRRAGAAG